MIAIDTNVVLRLLVRDHAEHYESALKLVSTADLLVSWCVLVECEWVLRRVYRLPRDPIADGIERLVGLPNVRVVDGLNMVKLLDAYRAGLDFADALHVLAAEAGGAKTFVTFDRELVRKAARLECALPIALMPEA